MFGGCYPPQCMREENRRNTMLRLFAVAGFALAVTTSAQAITPAPLPQPDGMITQVRLGCGPGRTRVGGVCVARTKTSLAVAILVALTMPVRAQSNPL